MFAWDVLLVVFVTVGQAMPQSPSKTDKNAALQAPVSTFTIHTITSHRGCPTTTSRALPAYGWISTNGSTIPYTFDGPNAYGDYSSELSEGSEDDTYDNLIFTAVNFGDSIILQQDSSTLTLRDGAQTVFAGLSASALSDGGGVVVAQSTTTSFSSSSAQVTLLAGGHIFNVSDQNGSVLIAEGSFTITLQDGATTIIEGQTVSALSPGNGVAIGVLTTSSFRRPPAQTPSPSMFNYATAEATPGSVTLTGKTSTATTGLISQASLGVTTRIALPSGSEKSLISTSTIAQIQSALACPTPGASYAYTDPESGDQYSVQCNTTYSGSVFDVGLEPDVATCISRCSENELCDAAGYNFKAGICYQYNAVAPGNGFSSPTMHFAQLRSRLVVVDGTTSTISITTSWYTASTLTTLFLTTAISTGGNAEYASSSILPAPTSQAGALPSGVSFIPSIQAPQSATNGGPGLFEEKSSYVSTPIAAVTTLGSANTHTPHTQRTDSPYADSNQSLSAGDSSGILITGPTSQAASQAVPFTAQSSTLGTDAALWSSISYIFDTQTLTPGGIITVSDEGGVEILSIASSGVGIVAIGSGTTATYHTIDISPPSTVAGPIASTAATTIHSGLGSSQDVTSLSSTGEPVLTSIASPTTSHSLSASGFVSVTVSGGTTVSTRVGGSTIQIVRNGSTVTTTPSAATYMTISDGSAVVFTSTGTPFVVVNGETTRTVTIGGLETSFVANGTTVLASITASYAMPTESISDIQIGACPEYNGLLIADNQTTDAKLVTCGNIYEGSSWIDDVSASPDGCDDACVGTSDCVGFSYTQANCTLYDLVTGMRVSSVPVYSALRLRKVVNNNADTNSTSNASSSAGSESLSSPDSSLSFPESTPISESTSATNSYSTTLAGLGSILPVEQSLTSSAENVQGATMSSDTLTSSTTSLTSFNTFEGVASTSFSQSGEQQPPSISSGIDSASEISLASLSSEGALQFSTPTTISSTLTEPDNSVSASSMPSLPSASIPNPTGGPLSSFPASVTNEPPSLAPSSTIVDSVALSDTLSSLSSLSGVTFLSALTSASTPGLGSVNSTSIPEGTQSAMTILNDISAVAAGSPTAVQQTTYSAGQSNTLQSNLVPSALGDSTSLSLMSTLDIRTSAVSPTLDFLAGSAQSEPQLSVPLTTSGTLTASSQIASVSILQSNSTPGPILNTSAMTSISSGDLSAISSSILLSDSLFTTITVPTNDLLSSLTAAFATPIPTLEPLAPCPSNTSYTTTDGSEFTIICDRTYSVDGLTLVDSPTLNECIEQCSGQVPCMGTIYSAANQTCQLSSSMSPTTGLTLGTFSVLRLAASMALQNQTETLSNSNFADGVLSPWVAEDNGNATGFSVTADMAIAGLNLAQDINHLGQASAPTTSQAAVSLRQRLIIPTGNVYSAAMNIDLVSSGDNICFVGMRTETLDVMQYMFADGSSYSGAVNATGANTAGDSQWAIVYAACTGNADATIGITNIVWNTWSIGTNAVDPSSSTSETNSVSPESTSSLVGSTLFTLDPSTTGTFSATTIDTASTLPSVIPASSTSASSSVVYSDQLSSASTEIDSSTSAFITSTSAAATSSQPVSGPTSMGMTSSSARTQILSSSESTYSADVGTSSSTSFSTGPSTTSDQMLSQRTSSTTSSSSAQGLSISTSVYLSASISLSASVSGSIQVSASSLAASSSVSVLPLSSFSASSFANQPSSSLTAITSSSFGVVTTSSAVPSSTVLSSPGSVTSVLETSSPTALTSVSTGFITLMSTTTTLVKISGGVSSSSVALSSSSISRSSTSSIGISVVLSSLSVSSSSVPSSPVPGSSVSSSSVVSSSVSSSSVLGLSVSRLLISSTLSNIASSQVQGVSTTSSLVPSQSSTTSISSLGASSSGSTGFRSSALATTTSLSTTASSPSGTTLTASRSTTSSTASSSSTAQPSLVCPQNDGVTYTGRDGSTYLLVCAQLYDTITIPGLPAFVTINLAACVDFCVSQGTQCQGVTWQPDTRQCRMKTTMAPATNSTGIAPAYGLLRTSGSSRISTEVLVNGAFDAGMDSWTAVTTGVTGLVVNLLSLGLTLVNGTVSCLINLSGLTALVSALTGVLNLYVYQTVSVNAGYNWFLTADLVLLQISSAPQTSCWIYFQTDQEILWSYLYNRTSANNQTIQGSGILASVASQFQARAQCNGTTDVNVSFDNLSWKVYPRSIGSNPMVLQPVSTLLNSAFSGTTLTPWAIAASSSANVDISVSSGAALMAFNRIATTASPAQLLQTLTTAAQANLNYSLTATVRVTIATGLLGVSTATCALSIDLLNQTTTLWSRSTSVSETNSVSVRGTLLNGATTLGLSANCVGTRAAMVTWDDVYLTLNPSS